MALERVKALTQLEEFLYGAKQTLKRHIKTVHKKRRDHACQYCPGVAFGEKSNLTKHVNVVHLKLREHACP